MKCRGWGFLRKALTDECIPRAILGFRRALSHTSCVKLVCMQHHHQAVITCTHSACTPLRWIRVHEAAFGLVTARASDPNLLRLVEGAVRLGTPLLLDELPEGSLPTGLDGLLQQRPAADKRPGRTRLCCIAHSTCGQHSVQPDRMDEC